MKRWKMEDHFIDYELIEISWTTFTNDAQVLNTWWITMIWILLHGDSYIEEFYKCFMNCGGVNATNHIIVKQY
jgi:hypothetical protein